MSLTMQEMNSTAEKFCGITDLPTDGEVRRLKEYYGYRWFSICKEVELYHVFTEEYVTVLAEIIKKLAVSPPIVEIVAGTGKLSYHLRKRGILVIPTDDLSWNLYSRSRGLVENLNHRAALEKYRPQLVIASWI